MKREVTFIYHSILFHSDSFPACFRFGARNKQQRKLNSELRTELEWNGKFEWKLGLVVWFVAVSFPLQNEKWNQTNNNNQLSSNYYLIQILIQISPNWIGSILIKNYCYNIN